MDVPVRPVTGRRLLLTLVLWPVLWALLLTAVVLIAGGVAGRSWLRSHPADLGAFVTGTAYVGLLAALLVAFGGPAGVRDRLGFRFTSLSDVRWALAAWIGALLIGSLLTGLLAFLLRSEPPNNTIDALRISLDPLFVGILVPTIVLLGPLAEELLFRGALFGWLSRFSVVAAVIISATVFAAAHLIPALFPFFFVFGVATALIYRRTGSTFNSFVMHACQNSMAVALAYTVIGRG